MGNGRLVLFAVGMVAATVCTSTPSSAVSTPVVSPTSAPATSAAPSLPADAGVSPVLPDPTITPGATDPGVSPATLGRTICRSGWTATVRPPESYTEEVKRLEAGAGGTVDYAGVVYQVHGFELTDDDISHYELDHLIPLELGGAPADPRNLWMEPYEPPEGSAAKGTGSQTKDQVENAARQAVCSGRLTLVDAQHKIAANWYTLGQELGVLAQRGP